MRLLHIILLAVIASVSFAESPKAAEAPGATVHGKLIQREGQTPAVETADHKLVILQGDGSTAHVLHDKRLAGLDVEAKGHFTAPDHFQVDPFHTRPLYVIKDGKHLMVTFWCDTCSIRTYTPGICWCCQQETALDLQDDDK